MFNITSSWVWPLNIAVIVIFTVFLVKGWKNGAIRELISLLGTIIAFVLALVFRGVFADRFMLVPSEWNPFANTIFADSAVSFINGIIWFVIVFIAVRILFFILDLLLKNFHKLPVVHTVSGVLGMAVSALEAWILCLVIVFFLATPIFSNSSQGVDPSFLGVIRDTSSTVISTLTGNDINISTFEKLAENASEMTEEEKNNLSAWLDGQGYTVNGENAQ